MNWEIPRCYDSHNHMLATGVMQSGLRLYDLKSSQDVAKLKIEKHHFRGPWLVGFGWDQSKWSDPQFPTAQDLDLVFPDFPVAFSRADGHATWLNSKAMELVGYLNKTESEKAPPAGGVVLRDQYGKPTGIFIETTKVEIESLIPSSTRQQNKDFLKSAIRYFNQRGYSHIRDMSGFQEQWELLRELDLENELTLYVDENFTCENIVDFERALLEAKQARATETTHLKARGIKFYFDGALGSEGAFISQFYAGTNKRGLTLWPLEQVELVIERTWKENFQVCIHAIGDEAVHQVVQAALRVKTKMGYSGKVNIEHAEMIRSETIEIMKNLDVTCHLQPCHWLTDQRWLKEKIPSLYQHVFPWAALQNANVKFQWGSDSPIEEASIFNNWRALTESPKQGIPPMQGNLLLPHTHQEEAWGPDCLSSFKDGALSKFIFDGRQII